MNNKTLLTKKRKRTRSKLSSGHIEFINSNSPMVQVNGFNVVELYYAESLENKNSSNEEQLYESNTFELKEENPNTTKKSENYHENIEMTKTKAKNIEEYYTSKFGISPIKENCFKCLMTDFLSNELLYFNSRKELFEYIKYCFVVKNKIIFTDEDILKNNKENFMNANTSFINGWRFFIPKTICKGCFMEIINTKYLICNIKNIFSDVERDSLCRTNYRNYALFSPRFRAAFKLNKKLACKRQSKSRSIRRNKKKFNNENNDDNKKEKEYNSNVKYDENKNVIIIDKKILDKTLLELIRNNSLFNDFYKKNNYKNILNENEVNKMNKNIKLINDINSNFNKGEMINSKNDNILFQGQNNINIINNISINSNSIKGIGYINFDSINQKTKELLNEINSNFNKFFSFLDNINDIVNITINYKQKLRFFLLYRGLSKFGEILNDYENFYKYFEENLNSLYEYLILFKISIENADNFFNNVINEIQENNNISFKDKKSFIDIVQEMKEYIKGNSDFLNRWSTPIHYFKIYYHLLYKSVKEMLSSQ